MNVPLSEKLRPKSLTDIVGQEHLLAEDGLISLLVRSKKPLSLLLWGPPGCGKTTLARLYAQSFDCRFLPFSAVFHGIAELKKILKDAQESPLLRKQLLLFVDEIHRFNKAQQDIFLPFIEDGTLILIGATTENPSFALNNALLSRLRVLTLNPLDPEALNQILTRYETTQGPLPLSIEGKQYLLQLAQGDGRHLLNLIENLQQRGPQDGLLDPEALRNLLQQKSPLYDKHQDAHYNLISALHKSVRGSDPDASLYWLARMFAGGEDPQFLCRRLVRMATEDIGLADPQALPLTLAACEAFERLGSPEGELAIAEAIVYLALAPKSCGVYKAWGRAQETAAQTTQLSPPHTILNAPSTLMKELGYGKGYQYDHDLAHAFSGQDYFPDTLGRQTFYEPVERGFEREMKKRIDYFAKLRERTKA